MNSANTTTATNTGANTADTIAEKPPRFDFPTWLPPMLVKELRQGLRTRWFVFSVIGLHTMLVITFAWALVVQFFNEAASLDNMMHNFLWVFTMVTLLLVMPLRGLGAIRPEIEARNVDLLVLTQLTSWRIVLGKWISIVAQSALLLVTLLPYVVMQYFLGGAETLDDLMIFGWVYAISCALTAAVLWVSGVHRFVRVLAAIGVVALATGAFGSEFSKWLLYGLAGGQRVFSSGGSSGDDFSVVFGIALALCMLFDMAIAVVFFLLQAARQIAPPSENHSPVTRLLALAMLLPIPLLFFPQGLERNMRQLLEVQSVLALIVFMLACVLELASVELPMAVHVRRLFGWGGGGRRLLCMLFLPGWTSAAIFTLAGLGFFAVMVPAGTFPEPLSDLRFLRVLGLAWVAVVLPAALMSLFVKRGKFAVFIVYVLLQVAAGLACLAGAYFINAGGISTSAKETISDVFRILPVTGFWYELARLAGNRHATVGMFELGAQLVICAGSVSFIAWCGKPFFRAYRAGIKSVKFETTEDEAG